MLVCLQDYNKPLCHTLFVRAGIKAMLSAFQFCFCMFLLKCQLGILHGLDDKAVKGETCSIGGGPTGSENGEEKPCIKDGLYSPLDVRLTRREGVALGHVETIHVDGDKDLQITTRSLKPPIFEIQHFLRDEECDHLVNLAKRNGLEKSTVAKGSTAVTREGTNATLTEEQMQMYCRRINRFDSNKDGNISLNEFAGFAYRMTRMLFDVNDLLTVYKTLLPEEARVFTYENCTKLNRTSFVEFVYQLFNIKRLPYYNVRYSDHSWVELSDTDPVLKRIKSRIAALTQMPVSQIEHSEALQVTSAIIAGVYFVYIYS